MHNDIELLDLMLRDQTSQKDVYRPSPYWKPYADRTIRAIRSVGIEYFRGSRTISKGFGEGDYADPFDPVLLTSKNGRLFSRILALPLFRRHFIAPQEKIIQSLWGERQKFKDLYYSQVLGNWFLQFEKQHRPLPDTLVGKPRQVVTLHDITIGEKYIQAFLRIQNYHKVIDFSQVTSVFEIGGGFGATAHSLLHLYPNIRKYLYLDIPPQIYLATQYLKHHFDQDVVDYRCTRELDRIEFSKGDSREIIAIPPWEIEKVDANIGLFWNCCSFEEMTLDIVVNYVKHINRILPNNDSRLCIMTYGGAVRQNKRSSSTIANESILDIVRTEGCFSVRELEPEIEDRDDQYFVGTK